MEPVTLRFARAAKVLADASRRHGLAAPGFRSPPRAAGLDRSLRRRGDEALISVKLQHRPWAAVAADMVEGVIAANGLAGPEADSARSALWASLDSDGLLTAEAPEAPRRQRPHISGLQAA